MACRSTVPRGRLVHTLHSRTRGSKPGLERSTRLVDCKYAPALRVFWLSVDGEVLGGPSGFRDGNRRKRGGIFRDEASPTSRIPSGPDPLSLFVGISWAEKLLAHARRPGTGRVFFFLGRVRGRSSGSPTPG